MTTTDLGWTDANGYSERRYSRRWSGWAQPGRDGRWYWRLDERTGSCMTAESGEADSLQAAQTACDKAAHPRTRGGRPGVGTKVDVRLPADVLSLLDAAAAAQGTTRAALCRDLLSDYANTWDASRQADRGATAPDDEHSHSLPAANLPDQRPARGHGGKGNAPTRCDFPSCSRSHLGIRSEMIGQGWHYERHHIGTAQESATVYCPEHAGTQPELSEGN